MHSLLGSLAVLNTLSILVITIIVKTSFDMSISASRQSWKPSLKPLLAVLRSIPHRVLVLQGHCFLAAEEPFQPFLESVEVV